MNVQQDKFSHHLSLLVKMAQGSALQKRHGACIFSRDKILSLGVNKQVCDWSIHAEIDAVFEAKSSHKTFKGLSFKGLDIFIIRIGKNYALRNSRPCQACISKLKEYKLRKAYYSNEKGEIVYEFIDCM